MLLDAIASSAVEKSGTTDGGNGWTANSCECMVARLRKSPPALASHPRNPWYFFKAYRDGKKTVGSMLCDLAPTARGSQDAESRNLGPASFTIFVLARDNELTELTWR